MSCAKHSINEPEGLSPVGNITIEMLTHTSFRVIWTYANENVQFQIDRKIGDSEWVDQYKMLRGEVKQFIETNLPMGSTITYRITVFTEDKTSIPAEKTITMKLMVEESFVLIEGGIFQMGSNTGSLMEQPVHQVTLSSFYLSKYELSQWKYKKIMKDNPSYFSADTLRPVEEVSWYNAIEYCNKRSIKEGLTPCYNYSIYGNDPAFWPLGWDSDYNNYVNLTCNWNVNGYRLPTEAEWEFAARGGILTNNYLYSGSNDLGTVGWFFSNAGSASHPLGLKQPNELGIHDMSGNNWEWCWDIYDSYQNGEQINPTGAVSGIHRVLRGGSWMYQPDFCRVANRNHGYTPTSFNCNIGFRLCRTSIR